MVINDKKMVINHNDQRKIHPDILSAIKNIKTSMKLIDNAKDVFSKARPVPIALEDKINDELIRLEKIGVITPCTTPVTNTSPVVWIKKTMENCECASTSRYMSTRKLKWMATQFQI